MEVSTEDSLRLRIAHDKKRIKATAKKHVIRYSSNERIVQTKLWLLRDRKHFEMKRMMRGKSCRDNVDNGDDIDRSENRNNRQTLAHDDSTTQNRSNGKRAK